ncbi:MAG: glycoside hydrolase family 99-like domain-containing protein, partial [Nitrospira sp.]|nr:glycoside hydrolase family 99-like domain-containing protein [Nitrospira sp.]
HYFRNEKGKFAQWSYPGKDPGRIKGPEGWRRDIWVGAPGDYPYVGPYDSTDPEVLRWQIRAAKAAGIEAFFLYVTDWQKEQTITSKLLDVAHEENFKIAFVDHFTALGSVPVVKDGRPQPLISRKYEVIEEIVNRIQQEGIHPGIFEPQPDRGPTIQSTQDAATRIATMLNLWKGHGAYLRIGGKPVIFIPYMDTTLTPARFKELVAGIKAKVNEPIYVIANIAQVYFYYIPDAVLGSPITMDWADTGADCFTHWTPNGMITADQAKRIEVNQFVVNDSRKWKKDSMIPMMPGFNDDAWRPGNVPAPTSPRAGGLNWENQVTAALTAQPNYIVIQAWNEWHEGSQIEASTSYSDPYLYLKLLAQRLGLTFKETDLPLPPPRS